MDPRGYHLTNVVVHSANAVVFYCIARRLIDLALPEDLHINLYKGAAFAAFLWALHPMRVEVVAWATARRDLLAGFFFLWVILFYLKGRTVTALLFYVLSLLSKASTLTLPLALLVIDWYPLRRGLRLREKLPFVVVAAAFASVAMVAQSSLVIAAETYTPQWRLWQVLYSAGFYLWRTFAVYEMSPFLMLPPTAISIALIVLTVVLTVVFFLLRDRYPAGLACWTYMIVGLVPVLGIILPAQPFFSDRYAYLACMSWAVLGGGVLSYSLRPRVQTRKKRRRREESKDYNIIFPLVASTAVLLVLASLSWKQTGVWKNSVALWTHVVTITPNLSSAHQNLAISLAGQQNYTAAVSHMRQALSIWPNPERVKPADMRNTLGFFLAEKGNLASALEELQTAAALDPTNASLFFNMGIVYARRGELEKSVENFEQALRLEPDNAKFHAELAKVLSRQGQAKEAAAHFKKAIELNPNLPFCVLNNCLDGPSQK
jgi:protein O-mannosyl-transferase